MVRAEGNAITGNVLILLDSDSHCYRDGSECVYPYLTHLGVPTQICDLGTSVLPDNLDLYALVILGHPGIVKRMRESDVKRLISGVKRGVGVVSFDPAFSSQADSQAFGSGLDIRIVADHPITTRHEVGEIIPLYGRLNIQPVSSSGEVLVAAGDAPLLVVSNVELGRIAAWSSVGWMRTEVLGPLGGIDDLLWRSLAWAARKPFVLRGLPPLITMRVDDVAATGHLWGMSPLWWAKVANRHGLKPWLGLFIYNLTEEAIEELRELIRLGGATAFPHAFGRPPRTPHPAFRDHYYHPQGLHLQDKSSDDFIYFDNANRAPWNYHEASARLLAVDEWYASHGPLPISPYALPHWSEQGANTLVHLRDRWGCDLIGLCMDPDRPLDGSDWIRAGPFRLYERPGSAFLDAARRGVRPVYYGDLMRYADREFFLSYTEIRDDAGYEWSPGGSVEESTSRGVRQLRRALDSFALPVLFTHETDHIYKIPPADWDSMLKGIASGVSNYSPRFVTLEEGIRTARATVTSRLVSVEIEGESKALLLRFSGYSDCPTGVFVFVDEKLDFEFVEIPSFESRTEIRVGL